MSYFIFTTLKRLRKLGLETINYFRVLKGLEALFLPQSELLLLWTWLPA